MVHYYYDESGAVKYRTMRVNKKFEGDKYEKNFLQHPLRRQMD
jgi:hypothetical protein